jgi:sugar phosphate isomerase/epimerase
MTQQSSNSPLYRVGEQEAQHIEARESLSGRLGLNVPYEWWPRAATLKAIEAAGFKWVQVASPPIEMLANPRHAVRHASELRRALEVTDLRSIVHGPTNLHLGSSLHNRAGEGLIEYAHQLGSDLAVYHALDQRKPGPETEAEERALRWLARWAETLDVVVCLENLSPVYPGEARLSHEPAAVKRLIERCDSPSTRMLLDVGHAHIVADRLGADLVSMIEPVLDVVALFHVHDNLGSRRQGAGGTNFDPLRLDLHLPPGIGSLPWESIAAALRDHTAPLMLEIHPAHRPAATTVRELTEAVLLGLQPSSGPATLTLTPLA